MSSPGAPVVLGAKPQTPMPPKPQPLGKSLTQMQGQLSDAVNTGLQTDTSAQASLSSITDGFHQSLADLKSQIPTPPELKPFQAPTPVNPIETFGSTAGILATLASGFSRAPLTTSLKAMTAGMQAIQQGNATNYNRAFKEWDDNTQFAIKSFDMENKHYDDLINLAKTDYDSAVAGVKTMASMADDKAMLIATAMKGMEGVEQLTLERQKLNLQMQENMPKLIPAQIFNHALQEYKVQNGGNDPPAPVMSQMWMNAQYGFGGMDGGSNGIVDAIGHYKAAPLNMSNTRNPQNKMIMDQVFAKYPEYAAEKYAGIQKAWLDFQPGGKDGALIASGNKAVQHLMLLQEAFNALHNGNVPMLNELKMKWLQATGSPLPTNYDAIAGVAAGELANFAVGGGGGGRGSTLADREETKATISRGMSGGQGTQAIDQYIGLMAGQVDAKRWQYNAAGLNAMAPFDNLLMPRMRQALAEHGGGANGSGGESGRFVNGTVYTDAHGNKALYQDGNWLPPPPGAQ